MNNRHNCKFIFITGGVISSVGKGLTTASIGALLQSMGFKIALRKLDPYLNVDPGTMSPTQHGEVFVTEDGTETDLDLGHYERFTDLNATKEDSITAGKIYLNLIAKERKGDYLGETVQVIPHVTDLIKEFIFNKSEDLDFILCEIGGTVGDIEGQPFFEAIRQISYEIAENGDRRSVIYIHVTLVPYVAASEEIKTKPTQHSVKALNGLGIQPNIIICRTEKAIPPEDIRKIALFCNVKREDVIQAIDVKSIYELPIKYREQSLDLRLLAHFELLESTETPSSYHGYNDNNNISINIDNYRNLQNKAGLVIPVTFKEWQKIISANDYIKKNCEIVNIALVGKYINLNDAYKSVIAALKHGGIANQLNVNIEIINARELEVHHSLKGFDGILVPGGFGSEGIKGKILSIKYARENNIPLFAICLGFQLAIIEYANNILNLEDANSTEFEPKAKNKVIALIEQWEKAEGPNITKLERRSQHSNIGGTMRLGAYECRLEAGSKISSIYNNAEIISERHRHRYEVNYNYLKLFKEAGLKFTGFSTLNPQLAETLELKEHPWFIGVQFHPEFKSRIFNPHPLFKSFIKAAHEFKTLRNA